jgi:hypothetical protein
MSDVKRRLRVLDRLEAPDVWRDAQIREPGNPPGDLPSRSARVGSIVAALLVAGTGLFIAGRAFLGGGSTTDPAGSAGQEYEGDAFVLDAPPAGPRLCFGEVLQSLPPQCVPGAQLAVTNWRWDGLGGEASQGARWGYYHVRGVFDGDSFTLTSSPGPYQGQQAPEEQSARQSQQGEAQTQTACPEPPGGWTSPDPERTSQADLEAASRTAGGHADFAGLWADRSVQGPPVLYVAFTGNLDGHEQEIRESWGGPLCLVRHERSLRELEGIHAEAEAAAVEHGIPVLTSEVNVILNRVELEVVVADEDGQDFMDARFGEGVVHLRGDLQPVG